MSNGPQVVLDEVFENGKEWGRREEHSRIRRELLDKIEALADVVNITSGPEEQEEDEGPIEMLSKEDLIDLIDLIIPEEG